ncbi:MAG TPA: PIN domain-containing protein [Solirubrobacterales bacterium]|nr:PIN domain-containing protein [Solirubrobacterales bacterium]
MADWTACLDACVLVPMGLCDSLLSIARTGIYRPIWSDEILAEVRRNLPQAEAADVEDRIAAMNEAFPDALVGAWRPMLSAVPDAVDPKDRHVVAAALQGQANVIVTDNLRDFAPAALASLNLSVQSADEFLVSQFEVDPLLAAAGVRQQLARLQRPPRTPAEHIELIRPSLPSYAEVLEEYLPLLGS